MAFAAVVSLKQTIERILLLPPKSKILLPNLEMKLISEELSYLQSFLEAISPPQSSRSKRVDAFGRQIKDVVHKLEDLIDFHISDQFLSASDDGLTFVFSQQLLEFRQEVSSFTNKILKTKEEYDINRQNQQQSDSSASETTLSRIVDYGGTKKKKIVGLGKELRELKHWILSDTYGRCSTMLIVGMAGIGKTIVVKQVYDDPEVIDHFDRRLFVTLGPHYQLKEILLLVLDQLKVDNEDSSEDSLSKLLIVLDDVWNKHIREELKHYLPDEVNQSRIIITSRIRDFSELFIEIPLLNDVESWNLLRDLKIGKEIAKKCEGLPLAIIEVGKLLRKKEKTVEEWQFIADKEDPLTIKSDDNTPLSNALLLSYTMLPQYLKVCFLYMSVFPKGYEISRSKLTKLWVAEGFLEPQKNKCLEETADECLNELISQSVVLKKKRGSIAKSENFFHVINKYPDSFPEGIDSQRRLCAHNNIVLGFEQAHIWMESVPIPGVRSLLCYGPKQQYPIRLYLPFRLLKVLDAVSMRFYEFPHQVVELFHLRYLAVTSNGEIPASISRLWNLEVLIIHQHHRKIKSSNSPVYLPVEIWKLHKLKHLECMGFDLPDPNDDDSLILEKLLTLSGVSAHSCTKRVLTRIPNLTKFGVRIETKDGDGAAAVEALSFLGGGDCFASVYEEFELFKCIVINPSLVRCLIILNFPANIRKISLSGCGFRWEYMRVIAELPNLRVLKLRWCAFSGPEWEMWRDDCVVLFASVEFLLMEDLDIRQRRVQSYHFPKMKRLIIRHCYRFTEIPIF
ncbi:hypothetical protein ABFS83_03G035400 [Erythranthe nasuta]